MLSKLIAALVEIEAPDPHNQIGYLNGQPHAYGPLQVTAGMLQDFNMARSTFPPLTLQELINNLTASVKVLCWYMKKNELTAGEPETVALYWHLGTRGYRQWRQKIEPKKEWGDEYLRKFREVYRK